MFVCECECVTDRAVVCVQMGGLVGGVVWSWDCRHDLGWGLSSTQNCVCYKCH